MRSQTLALALVGIALAGCGKDVQRNAQLNGQVNGMGRGGPCVDPLESMPYQPILRADELRLSGTYSLLSFQAVGLASQQQQTPSHASGISVVSGGGNGSDLQLRRVCSDFSQIQQSDFQWGISAPSSIHGNSGSVSEEISITQNIRGSQIIQESLTPGRARECLNTASMIQGSIGSQAGNCSGAQFFRVDQNTIGVLRTVDSSDGRGLMIRSKIFAQYTTGSVPIQSLQDLQESSEDKIPRETAPARHPRKPAPKRVFIPKDVSGPVTQAPVKTGKARVITTSDVVASGTVQSKQVCCKTGTLVVTSTPAPQVIIVKQVPAPTVVVVAPPASPLINLGTGNVKIVAKHKEVEKLKTPTEFGPIKEKKKEKSKLLFKVRRN